MKTRKNTTKKAAAVKPKPLNVNLDYVDQITDEATTTTMALRALIHTMANEIADLRAQLEGRP